MVGNRAGLWLHHNFCVKILAGIFIMLQVKFDDYPTGLQDRLLNNLVFDHLAKRLWDIDLPFTRTNTHSTSMTALSFEHLIFAWNHVLWFHLWSQYQSCSTPFLFKTQTTKKQNAVSLISMQSKLFSSCGAMNKNNPTTSEYCCWRMNCNKKCRMWNLAFEI